MTLFGDPKTCGIASPVLADYRRLRRDQAPRGPYGPARMGRLTALGIAWRRRPR